ncbi:MAG TPA: chorismate-binding protein [Thermoanaerobaculia bacterium]|nr:chorismate-binding protein [Thermoanaerobaculia bacterium]
MNGRRVVTRTRELLAETLTPLAAYQRLAGLSPVRFLLESVTGGEQVARYSFLGAAPRARPRLFPDRREIVRADEVERVPGAPLDALRATVTGYRAEPGPVPFCGGFVGCFGFDLVRLVERIPSRPPDPWGLPVAELGLFDSVVAFDHAQQKLLLMGNEIEGETDASDAEAALDRLEAALTCEAPTRAIRLPAEVPEPAAASEVSLSGTAFRAAVGRAKEHVAAGDIFQVVLARRFSRPSEAPPVALYRALRRVNPSPYMVLFELPDLALIGASPEALVTVTGRRVVTRPIAGTRHRGRDAAEDTAIAAELLADPKERAEHVMLVDLGRNDLGRVCRPGSVEVASFLGIERYSHVVHMVSSVEGELAPGRDALDALLATFPAGTVSGAPKIRAIEILDALEPEARGFYAGATGYLSFTGDLDACITIRTLVSRPTSDGREVSVTAGAGIVADSVPEREQRETESKAAGLLAAVALAERLEEGA